MEKLLEDGVFSFLTDQRKKRCVHLVSVHDKKHEIKEVDELILAEADILSGIDISNKPKLDAESNKKFMDSVIKTRLPKFITKFSREGAEKLIQKRINYYENI